jgi:hypothetical protein
MGKKTQSDSFCFLSRADLSFLIGIAILDCKVESIDDRSRVKSSLPAQERVVALRASARVMCNRLD